MEIVERPEDSSDGWTTVRLTPLERTVNGRWHRHLDAGLGCDEALVATIRDLGLPVGTLSEEFTTWLLRGTLPPR